MHCASGTWARASGAGELAPRPGRAPTLLQHLQLRGLVLLLLVHQMALLREGPLHGHLQLHHFHEAVGAVAQRARHLRRQLVAAVRLHSQQRGHVLGHGGLHLRRAGGRAWARMAGV
jgi:hypothetical protein